MDHSLRYCEASPSAMGAEELRYGVREEDFANESQLVTAIQEKDPKHNQGLNDLHNIRVLNPNMRWFPLL